MGFAVALCQTLGGALAGEPASPKPASTPPASASTVDKRQFTLWNPTPSEHLREMNALYDSPWTVDAGRFQLETYAVGYAHNHRTARATDTTTELWSAGAFTLKAGLLDELDAEIAWTPYSWLRSRDNDTGRVTHHQGFGEVVPRLKLNLWGNDGGSTALAVLPFVKLPTSQDDLGNKHLEGGLILPFGVELPGGWWTILINEFHCLHGVYDETYHPAFANTAYLWHQIHGNLSGFADFYSWASTERGVPWWGSVEFGLTYLWSKNIQLDLGVSLGVTKAADDANPYLGVSFRF